MQRRNLKFSLLFAAAGVAALVLAGCSSAGENSGSTATDTGSTGGTQTDDSNSGGSTDAQTSGNDGEAVLSYDSTKYTVALQFCSLYDTGDALFHGLALDDAGNEVGYLEGDFLGLTDIPSGEARLDFGATAQMQSKDTFIAMGGEASSLVVTDFSEGSLIMMGGVWDENGTVLSTSMLRVTC